MAHPLCPGSGGRSPSVGSSRAGSTGWRSIAGQKQPPARFVAGADAIEAAVAKVGELLAHAEASRELGGDLAHDGA
ncbi:hypothetical protein [Streptomyces sp. NPDC006739]|uniref:hypothetical protein n=1 Tax=Streptomyces sp. NPDC006739 TaxID=3364763 RepID=UPI00367EB7D3